MIRKIIISILMMVFIIGCVTQKQSSNIVLGTNTPEATIKRYFYAFKTSNYDLAKSCFVEGQFLIPKELIKDIYNKTEIIDKYMIGYDDKEKHLYTDFDYKLLNIDKGNVQIVVRKYFKADNYVGDTIFILKKINAEWLIYSYASTGDD
jgi:hypothetical protein